MSIEEKKNYLKGYRVQQAKIKRLEQMVFEAPEKKEKYLKLLQGAVEKRDKIEEEIESVDGGILSEILFQKYICCHSLEEIAYMISYSKRQTERMHIKALTAFEKN